MGFCLLNNVAVAAAAALAAGARRVAIVDWDVHHGNGTQAILYQRDDVFFCSVHGDPRELYPWYAGYGDETGSGKGLGCNLNLPLAAGTGNAGYVEAVDAGLAAIRRFDASVLIVSLGFDAHVGDPTANLAVTGEGFRAIGERIGGQERSRRRAVPPRVPRPFSGIQMRHRVANGLEAVAHVPIELLGCQRLERLQHAIARPVVIVDQRPEILKVHRITTA
jgi:acetoin utilization deacetylase AcuC-like enzyme